MWAAVKAASVKQENLVNLMQVDMLQLSVTQTQLDNLCLQSTLIIGFTLSILSGETLKPLVDDSEQSCIWKSTMALAFGHILFYMIATCVGCCIVSICLISYLKQHSQEAALTVSTGAAAAITRRHIHLVNTLFVTAMICFSIAAAFLVILFVGFPKRHHYGGPITDDNDVEGLVEMPDGSWTITCLSPLDDYANKERDVHGKIIASINTAIFFSFAAFGTYKFLVRAEAAVSSPPRPPPRLRPPARAWMRSELDPNPRLRARRLSGSRSSRRDSSPGTSSTRPDATRCTRASSASPTGSSINSTTRRRGSRRRQAASSRGSSLAWIRRRPPTTTRSPTACNSS